LTQCAARESGHVTSAGSDTDHPHAPDLEVVEVSRRSPIKAWAHGYPFRTVRWHFHPEYEIHLVTATSGRSFIGDYVGNFSPGNLVIVGPNLPHNWISDIGRDTSVDRRSIVIQFSETFVRDCVTLLPELGPVDAWLRRASRGLEAIESASAHLRRGFEDLLCSEGAIRIGLFFQLLGRLSRIEYRPLASEHYTPRPDFYASQPMNRVLEQITQNLSENITQAEMAELSGFSAPAFSRAFKQHTGVTFVRYVNLLRINKACDLLRSTSLSVADICYQVGFNNLSNFNRQFLALMKVSPSGYRLAQQELTQPAARDRPGTTRPSPRLNTVRAPEPLVTL
jgi:AraC-like DNA-binding protein